MAEVFAGMVCGFALALIATPLAALALVRARVSSETVARLTPEGSSLVAVSIILHGFAFLTFTAVGMVFGMLLNGLESSRPDSGLGSPNAAYTVLAIAIVAVAALPLAVVAPRWRVALLTSGLMLTATFGWAMPWLAAMGD